MNPQQLANLIDRHAAALILYARQWCDTPEDVVQDALIKCVQLREMPIEPVSWLYRVVRNRALDAAKSARRRRHRETVIAPQRPWFIEPEIDGLDAEVAVAAIERLPLEQRELVVAHLWGGLNFEQLGTVSGCSASTAHRRYTAAIAALRKTLGIPCTSDHQ